MAPRAGGATNPASKKGVRKRPRISTTARDSSISGRTEERLLLLWRCYRNKGGKVDFGAVARDYGISSAAAKLRMSRLEAHLAEMDSGRPQASTEAAQTDQADEANQDAQGDADQDMPDDAEDNMPDVDDEAV